MNEFDIKASGWDKDPMHWDRSVAVANEIKRVIPLRKDMTALEYGAGTGITSFLLKDLVREITLIDSSPEMVRVMNEKIKTADIKNLNALHFDLEVSDYKNGSFDLIFTQMVLHHIEDTEKILKKFCGLLNPGGFLAIADLYSENGSFHGEGFSGHNGFDVEELSELLEKYGFSEISHHKCFVINKKISDTVNKQFGVFLLTAKCNKFEL
jgi:tRNA (cmo5U34)-methyltransferase